MNENATDIITAEHVNLWYEGTHHALKDINLNMKEKSITALIGPSGCGKSTFLRTLNRMNDLIPGTKIEGKISYRGQDIYDPKVDINNLRKNIGMVFQKPNPFPMSIYNNIAYGPRTHGIRNKAKLDEIVEKSPAALPSGMRSRTVFPSRRSGSQADSSSVSALQELLP